MNPWQMALQLRHVLRQIAWPVGAEALVFGEHQVAIFGGQPTGAAHPANWPWCLIGIGNALPDEDHPDLLRQNFGLTVAADVIGDRLGQSAIVGGPAADVGKSAGRGVHELAGEVRRAVSSLTGADGARILVTGIESGPVLAVEGGKHLATVEIGLAAWCTATPYYVAPQRLRYLVSKWMWNGAHCEARFDFWRYQLVRKTGTNPSLDPTDGTIVYTGATPSFTGPQISGQTYTVFAEYNARGIASFSTETFEGRSAPERGSYRVA